MSQAFHREPTFYTTSNAAQTGYNKADRERVIMVKGRPVRERHPQAGHLGDYDQPMRMRGEGSRWITVCKNTGSVVKFVITAGAGDMDANSQLAIERRRKMRALGWFFWGGCPAALARTGHLVRDHFVDPRVHDAEPCRPGTYNLENPCPHAIAERDARIAAHNVIEGERSAATKTNVDRNLEQQSAMLAVLSDLAKTQAEIRMAAISPVVVTPLPVATTTPTPTPPVASTTTATATATATAPATAPASSDDPASGPTEGSTSRKRGKPSED